MKFLGGFISGIISTIVVLFIIYTSYANGDARPGLTIFSEKGECITNNQLEIFQTIEPDMALAQFNEFPNESLVLLINYENQYYYDTQKIEIPNNKCARQIGIYQYKNKMEIQKTVPVVVIE